MKRQIRKGVFETNSSSMHAIAITRSEEKDTLTVDKEQNKVITKFGEFGFGLSTHTDAETKLSYLVTMLVEIHYTCYSLEELYQTEDFKMINEAVARCCGCDGVVINSMVRKTPWMDETFELNDHDGWVDHMSYEDYDSVAEFLERVGCTVEEFLFNKSVKLVIKCDGTRYKEEEDIEVRGEWAEGWYTEDEEEDEEEE